MWLILTRPIDGVPEWGLTEVVDDGRRVCEIMRKFMREHDGAWNIKAVYFGACSEITEEHIRKHDPLYVEST